MPGTAAPFFVHDHLSGRFSASAAEEENAVDIAAMHADLFTTTEIDQYARAKALKQKGFHHVFGNKGPRDDTGIMARKSRFDMLEGGTRTLSPLRYQTESHGLSDTTEGAFMVVRDLVSKKIGVVVVVHMPHGMQEALRANRPGNDVAHAYRDIIKGARRLANGLARTYRADWTMIVGDWNLDVKHAWVPVWLKAEFPGFKVNWTKPYPKWGTFHSLIIDLALLRGLSVKGQPEHDHPQPGFDHIGWTERLY